MKKLSTLNSALALLFAYNVCPALDPMYDYRYTLGPEILVPETFNIGVGGYTRRNESYKIVLNSQFGLGQNFEIGSKFLFGTNDDWVLTQTRERNYYLPIIDIGAKYAIKPHLVVQADVPFTINKDWDWGGVLTLTQWDGYTKNVSFLYEGRLGFGGPAGEDCYVKPSAAFIPNFQIGQSLRLSTGVISSFGNFKDDFMIDILPKVEVGLKWFHLRGEVAIGVINFVEKDRRNKFSLYVVSDM